MGWVQAVVFGSFLGVVSTVPSALLFERAMGTGRPPSVAMGLASILGSFLVLAGAEYLVWTLARGDALAFGVSETASFLGVWVVEALRAWRDAQRGVAPGERKTGESAR